MNKPNEFIIYIQLARTHQGELRTIYKSIISLINDLRERSKVKMHEISYLEDGLDLNLENKPSDKQNIDILTQDIKKFNLKINTIVQNFNSEYDLILNAYLSAILAFNNDNEEKDTLLRTKEELLILDKLLRRFREKIAALQQMNNVLFSFSEDFRKVKEDYKNNLSKVNFSISTAIDNSHKVIEEIQSILLKT